MFKVKAPETFDATLTIVGQGREQKLKVKYRHLLKDAYKELMDKLAAGEVSAAQVVLDLVAEWDAAPPPHWLEQRATLMDQVAFFRRHGYVVSLGDWYTDLNGCAAPVFSHRHGRWFYFNCGGHSDIVKPELIEREIAPRLLAMCRTIENVLMGVESTPMIADGPEPPTGRAG